MTVTRTESRLRARWAAAHAPAAGVPRWARLAALAVPLAVLPSSVWRIASWFFDEGVRGQRGDLPAWVPGWAYLVFLSVLSELFAFTAVGLVARWGEVFPRWVPFLRGRGVPPMAAIVPAALGTVAVTVLWTTAFISQARGVTITGEELSDDFPTRQGAWEAAALYVSYAPLLLWGPLLGAVTWAYWRRRRTPR
ncbi:hypothetical protein ABT390_02030 [Streptomyces aurantiacus]|uniref:Uncharacterized protein n=1 Tax=Streptomyces aurantiacus JA 4570 TaxID=1286094 RepID=S4AQE2_9ACTN|nr:hypothetical protein [Streptomyces aurantiacus]EPH43687.1 hypothetical protein STRAU_3235 [Streptomyces aurantiacus JA 4570]